MRVKIAIPEPHVSKPVLDAGLEAVTRLDEQMIAAGEVPSFERGLRYGVKWRPEPKGDEHFDSADRVLARRMGDCDDLAPWHAASLRVSGEDPGARAVVRRSGPKRWHAVVLRSDGSIDDPSLRAGMKAGVAPMPHGVMGAVVPAMIAPSAVVGGAYIVRPQIALRPVHDQIQARADLPWTHDQGGPASSHNLSMTALHRSPVAATALTGAINDVCDLALCSGIGRGDHIERLQCIADACQGASFDDLVHVYGEDHAEAASAVVGSLFGKLGRGLGKLARGAVSFVPGGNLALSAVDTGRGLLHHKHHGAAPPDQTLAPAQPGASPGASARPQRAPVPGITPGVAAVETSSGRPIHIHVH